MSKMITYAQKLDGVSCDGTTYYSDCVSQPALGCTSASGWHNTTIYKLNLLTAERPLRLLWLKNRFAVIGDSPRWRSLSNRKQLFFPGWSKLNRGLLFNCSQESAAAPAKIDIFLDLKARSNTIFSESQAELPFETSVVIRNSGDR